MRFRGLAGRHALWWISAFLVSHRAFAATLDLQVPEVRSKAPPSAVTLDRAISRCLLADPHLRSAYEAVCQAQADLKTASLRPNPVLNPVGSLLPLTHAFTPDNPGGPPQVEIDLAWPVDWLLFGKRVAAMQSARLGVGVSESQYADLVRLRVTEVATTFYDVLESRDLAALARQDVDELLRVQDVTRRGMEYGGRAPVDVDRVGLDISTARRALEDALAAKATSLSHLRALMGASAPEQADPEVAGSLSGPVDVVAPTLPDALARALADRPDLEALRRRISQATVDITKERRNGQPSVTPLVGYAKQFQETALAAPDAFCYTVGVQVSLNVFDRNQGNRDRARSVERQSRHDLDAAVIDLRNEVRAALVELERSRANARQVDEQQLVLATRVRESIKTAFEAGGRPLLDVLDAQRSLREARRAFTTSRASYFRAVKKLDATLGRKVAP